MLAEGIRVSKSNPCPVCQKHDWCYAIGTGDTTRILCTRLKRDSLLLPDYLEETDTTDKEGFPFLKLKVEEKAPRPDKTIEYIYTRDSIPVLKVVTKYANGKKQGVYPYLWSEGQWNMRSGLGDIPETSFPLFNQDAVIAAKERHVFLVEGESCAKALNDLGFVATTIRGKTFSQEHIDILSACKWVVLCPDRDITGVEFMTKARLALETKSTPLKQLLAPPHNFFWRHLPSNGGLDVADWINDGADKKTIQDAVTKITEVIGDAIAPDVNIDENTKLEQSIKYWLAETDPIRQMTLARDIRLAHKIDKPSFDKCVAIKSADMYTAPMVSRSAKDFMNEGDAEINWLVSNMMAVGEMILLSGSPGRGKSIFAMFLMHKLLREGSIFLNESAMKSCKVMFISGDQSDRTTRKRFREMGTDQLPEFSDNVRIISNFRLEMLRQLEQELDTFKPDFVVVDSLTSITLNSGISENDAEFAHAIYRLRDLLGNYNAASLLIHHLNKTGTESGSLRITAPVWAVWRLESAAPDNPDCNLLKLTMPKTRDSEKLFLDLEFNQTEDWKEKGVFSYLGETKSGKIHDDVTSIALGVLKDGSMSADELAIRCSTTVSTLRVAMHRAKNKGLVESQKPQGSRFGVWMLTDKGKALYPMTPKQVPIAVQPRTPIRYPNLSDPNRQDIWKSPTTPPPVLNSTSDDDEFF